MIRIGIIGCGTIGAKLAEYIDTDLINKARLTGISDIDEEKTRNLAEALRAAPERLGIGELIDSVDLVIEAASAKISLDVARRSLNSGKDIMVMSTGGLIKDHRELFELAKKRGADIYLPSGAICGLDGLKAARFSRIDRVTLTTRKPPEGFKGAPYVEKNRISLESVKSDTVLFEGNALEAMEGFPANINVAATLSLCGIGSEKTRVRIIASPSSTKNIHEVEVEGEFGRLLARTENVPSPDNPRTSYLAILSAIATLNGIMERVKIGT